jgi:hypothetical protein
MRSLPGGLMQYATDEFVRLVKSDFITKAADDILVATQRPIGDMLLATLPGIDSQKFQFFSRLLDARGFVGTIPCLENSSHRPVGQRASQFIYP